MESVRGGSLATLLTKLDSDFRLVTFGTTFFRDQIVGTELEWLRRGESPRAI